jgi:uncharacterized protein GlcG (DUF336 family)
MNRTHAWIVLAAIAGVIAGIISYTATPAVGQQDRPRGEAVVAQIGDAQAGEPLTVKDISLDQAHTILAAALRKAVELDSKMDIAVVDAGGNLKAFVRMDGAWLGSIDISIRKAKTARFFDMNTGEIGRLSQPGGPLYGIEHSNDGLITFPGGVPLRDGDGSIIGAIGVSGDTVEKDHEVAEAGAAAIEQ